MGVRNTVELRGGDTTGTESRGGALGSHQATRAKLAKGVVERVRTSGAEQPSTGHFRGDKGQVACGDR